MEIEEVEGKNGLTYSRLQDSSGREIFYINKQQEQQTQQASGKIGASITWTPKPYEPPPLSDDIKKIYAEKEAYEKDTNFKIELAIGANKYGAAKAIEDLKLKHTEKDLQQMFGDNYNLFMSGNMVENYQNIPLKMGDLNKIKNTKNMIDGVRGTLTDMAAVKLFGQGKEFIDATGQKHTNLDEADVTFGKYLNNMGIPYLIEENKFYIIDPETKKLHNVSDHDLFSLDTAQQIAWNLPGVAVSIAGGMGLRAAKIGAKFASKLPKVAGAVGMADALYSATQIGIDKGIEHTPLGKDKNFIGQTVNIFDAMNTAETAIQAAKYMTDNLIGALIINSAIKAVAPTAKKVGKAIKNELKEQGSAIKKHPFAYVSGATASTFILPFGSGVFTAPTVGKYASKAADMFFNKGSIVDKAKAATEGAGDKIKNGLEGLTKAGNGTIKENVADNVAENLGKGADKFNEAIYNWGKDKPAFVKNITDTFSPNNNRSSTIIRRMDDELKYLAELYPNLKDPSRTAEVSNQAYHLGFIPESGDAKDTMVLHAFASNPNTARFWKTVNGLSATSMGNMGHYMNALTASITQSAYNMIKFSDSSGARSALVSNLASTFAENNKALREMVKSLDSLGASVNLDYAKFGGKSTTEYKTGQLKQGDAVTLQFDTLGYTYSNIVNKIGKGAQPLFLDKPMASYAGKDASMQTTQSAVAITKPNNPSYIPTNKLGSDVSPGALKAYLQHLASGYDRRWGAGQLAEMYVNLKTIGAIHKLEGANNKDYNLAIGVVGDGLRRALGARLPGETGPRPNNIYAGDAVFEQLNILINTKAQFERFARTELYQRVHAESLDTKQFKEILTRAAQKQDLGGLSELQQLSKFLRGPNADAIRKHLDYEILQGIIQKTAMNSEEESIINLVRADQLIKDMNFITPEARITKEYISAAGKFFNEDIFELLEPSMRKKILDSGISSDYVKRAKVALVSRTFRAIPRFFSGTEQGKEERLAVMAVRALANNFSAQARRAFESNMQAKMQKGMTPTEIEIHHAYQTTSKELQEEYNAIRAMMHDMEANPNNYVIPEATNADEFIDQIYKQNNITPPPKTDDSVKVMNQAELDSISSSAVKSIDTVLRDAVGRDPTFVPNKQFYQSEDFIQLVVDTLWEPVKIQNKMGNDADLAEITMTVLERYMQHVDSKIKSKTPTNINFDYETIDRVIKNVQRDADNDLDNLINQ